MLSCYCFILTAAYLVCDCESCFFHLWSAAAVIHWLIQRFSFSVSMRGASWWFLQVKLLSRLYGLPFCLVSSPFLFSETTTIPSNPFHWVSRQSDSLRSLWCGFPCVSMGDGCNLSSLLFWQCCSSNSLANHLTTHFSRLHPVRFPPPLLTELLTGQFGGTESRENQR